MLEPRPHGSAHLPTTESPAEVPPRWAAPLLALLVVVLHAPALGTPFPDGPHGNCGGMFGIIARNALALGLEARGVPVLNPVAPDAAATALFYTHHPPGLPWLTTLAQGVGALTGAAFETSARLVAMLLSWWAAVLMLRLATGTAGRAVGFAAALFMLALPAGRHHGALVNYETIALPALLWLHLCLVTRRGPAFLAGLVAALCDWIALFPLVTGGWAAGRQRWVSAVMGGLLGLVAFALLYRSLAPSTAGANLGQALGASFLAPGFDVTAWRLALQDHLLGLYGFTLALAPLCLFTFWSVAPRAAGALFTFLTVGVLNVTLFAQHATGHFHFSLLLLPFIALGSALALAPLRRTRAGDPGVVIATVLVVALHLLPALEAGTPPPTTHEADLADRFAAVTATDTIYLRPHGASFVFLHRAERHVVPFPSADREQAQQRVTRQREDFGAAGLPAQVVLAPDETAPAWLVDEAPVREADGFRFYTL